MSRACDAASEDHLLSLIFSSFHCSTEYQSAVPACNQTSLSCQSSPTLISRSGLLLRNIQSSHEKFELFFFSQSNNFPWANVSNPKILVHCNFKLAEIVNLKFDLAVSKKLLSQHTCVPKAT
jgi:hypothetical protein